MEVEQFISSAVTELEMVEAQLRDVEARAVALRARGDGLRFLIQYGREAQAGVRTADTTPSDIGARRVGRATGKVGLPASYHYGQWYVVPETWPDPAPRTLIRTAS
jgi:hypothetical protein